MSGVRVVWRGEAVEELERLAMQRVAQAAETLARRVRKDLEKVDSETSGRSRPGETPHRESGELAESVVVERGEDRAAVAATAEHARMLELGTSRMKARPFLRPALEEERETLRAVIEGGGDGQ